MFILKDDSPLPSEERFITEYHRNECRLTIKDVTIDDEAYYRCEAKNEHGVANTVVELFVESKSSISRLMPLVLITLPCVVLVIFCLRKIKLERISQAL